MRSLYSLESGLPVFANRCNVPRGMTDNLGTVDIKTSISAVTLRGGSPFATLRASATSSKSSGTLKHLDQRCHATRRKSLRHLARKRYFVEVLGNLSESNFASRNGSVSSKVLGSE